MARLVADTATDEAQARPAGAIDVLAEPLCLSGHGWDGQIALRDDRILLVGGAVTYVYERAGENARFVRAIPTTIHDMSIGSDGHADVVVGARDGDKTKSVVVRLSQQEVDGVLR